MSFEAKLNIYLCLKPQGHWSDAKNLSAKIWRVIKQIRFQIPDASFIIYVSQQVKVCVNSAV